MSHRIKIAKLYLKDVYLNYDDMDIVVRNVSSSNDWQTVDSDKLKELKNAINLLNLQESDYTKMVIIEDYNDNITIDSIIDKYRQLKIKITKEEKAKELATQKRKATMAAKKKEGELKKLKQLQEKYGSD